MISGFRWKPSTCALNVTARVMATRDFVEPVTEVWRWIVQIVKIMALDSFQIIGDVQIAAMVQFVGNAISRTINATAQTMTVPALRKPDKTKSNPSPELSLRALRWSQSGNPNGERDESDHLHSPPEHRSTADVCRIGRANNDSRSDRTGKNDAAIDSSSRKMAAACCFCEVKPERGMI